MEKVPPHPSRTFSLALMGSGALGVVLGAALAIAPVAVLGCTALLLGAYQWRMGIAASTANTAAAAINRGELERARALVGLARGNHRMTYIHRLLDSHEAEIAWRAGELETAQRFLAAGRARRQLVPYGAWRRAHMLHIDALLALVQAVLGDERAEQLIEEVRRATQAQAGQLARVELAHAMLLARRGDLNALHRHLMRHHVLLSEGLEPRGRSLHRVLRRMTATRSTSAYRLPVKNVSPPKQGANASWMSRVFPAGTELLELDEGGTLPAQRLDAPAPPPPPGKAPTRSRTAPLVVVWGILLIFAVAAYQWLRVPGEGPPEIPFRPIIAGFLLLVVALLVGFTLRARSGTRVLEEAQRALICGELDRAETLARSLRDDQNKVLGASASLLIANVLERRADFSAALTECERGLSLLTGLAKLGTSDVLLPQLIATRAYLFAALGREQDSEGELARLAREYPAFPYASGRVLKTKLVRAARRGDFEEARELARARGDVSVGAYAELLADLVTATDPDRMLAVREDLAALPEADRWIRALAPRAFDQSVMPTAIAPASHTPAIET